MVALMVIGMIVLFITADLIYQKVTAVKQSEATAVTAAQGMKTPRVPAGIFLSPQHTWLCVSPNGRITLGADDFLRSALGEVEAVNLPEPGTRVKRGDTLAVLSRGGKSVRVVSPVSGEIHSVNSEMAVHPQRLSESPYGDGWLCSVRPTALSSELRGLRVAEEAADWLRAELARFTDFLSARIRLSPAHAAVMADGGQIIEGPLGEMDAADWREFEATFLS